MVLKAHGNVQPTPEAFIEVSKKFESYVWGGFAPITHVPNQLNTVSAAATATKDMLVEMAQNTADPAKAKQVEDALAVWERFLADISFALEPPTVPPSAPRLNVEDDDIPF